MKPELARHELVLTEDIGRDRLTYHTSESNGWAETLLSRAVARGGQENQLRELLRGMLAPTRAESGCKLYELYESGSPRRFYFYEIWESQTALDQHAASAHYKHLEQSLGELLQEPFEINILERVLTGAAAA